MAKIRVLVAEDNPIHARKIEMLLDEMGYDSLGVCSTAEHLLRSFKATRPDLVLLDIELDEGDDGIRLAGEIIKISPTPIIFISARDDLETISRANQTNPYAYIVKPFEKPTLQASMELAIFRFSQDMEKETLRDPFTGWSEDLLVKDSFFIKAGGKLEKVKSNDIIFLEVAEDRYCNIITGSRNYHIRASINSLADKLDPGQFVRIHRRHIVNAEHIDSIDEADMTVDIAGRSLPIGKTYKVILLKRLNMLQ